MSSRFVAFALYDATGAVLTTATPSFTVYKGSDGVSRTPPTITNRGGGLYTFKVPAADAVDGVAFLVSCGSSSVPKYVAGSDGGRIQAFALYDNTGAPLAGQAPGFSSYLRSDGTTTTQPGINAFGLGLYAFIPSESDFAIGVAYVVTSGALPSKLGGYAQQCGGYDAPAQIPPPSPATPDVPATTEAYGRQIKSLLPPGSLWKLETDSTLTKALLALATEYARVDARGLNLLDEADPRTANETLDWWESALGLPDSAISTIPATTAQRQLAITQKLTARGGQTPAFFEALGAACGYTVVVTDGYAARVLRSGFISGAGCYGEPWGYFWLVTVQPPAGSALSHTELEALFNRAKPAHTVVGFTYL